MDDNGADFLKRLLETFRVEAEEHLETISRSLLALETGASPQETDRLVEAAFREAHSMKGAARSVNLTGIERVCQAVENVFSELQRGKMVLSAGLFDVLHRGVNVLSFLVSTQPDAASERDRVTTVVAEINGALAAKATDREGAGGGAESPPPEEPSAPSPYPVAPETVRVGKETLDSLLLQVESFITLKQSAARRAREGQAVREALDRLKKAWPGESALRRTGSARETGEYVSGHSERVLSLSQQVAVLSSRLDQDRRMAAVMVDHLLGTVKSVSLLPFSSLTDLMGKLVRDLSHDLGKIVSLETRGGDIEVDRRVLDEMREPLIHLIRNSVDHGIEPPEERVERGKGETGRIVIAAGYREGQWIELTVSDDGRGVDVSEVAGTAVRLGVVSEEDADQLDRSGIGALLFHSGLSTSRMITDLSGRGLGLAIVRERVERLGGSIDCEWQEGKGTAFHVLLPLSLATFRGLVVRSGDRRFIIPSTSVRRALRVAAEDVRRDTVVIDGRVVPARSLDTLLELPAAEQPEHRRTSRMCRIVVVGSGDSLLALMVDEVVGEQEVLVKRLGSQLVRVRNVLAATVLEDGEIVTILNVPDLLKSARHPLRAPAVPAKTAEGTSTSRSVLVVEDSITSRSLLKNILEAAGYTVRTAVDGIDALSLLGTGEFDLVVSDVDMPRMNGFDLTARIRSDSRFSFLPVVLVTSLRSREDQERGIDAGANAYIVKGSFDQSNLLETVRRLL